jgi:hypothetical protein
MPEVEMMLTRTVLTLSLAVVGSVAPPSLIAQDATVAPNSDLAKCVRWMKATVSEKIKVDPTDFCSGVQTGELGGWATVFDCGHSPEPLTSTVPKYCASRGDISPGHAWAVGYSSSTKYGSDLLDETSSAATDSQHAGATFYSTIPTRMENLRMPAGMYKLVPVKSPDGWKLKVAKQDGDSTDGADTVRSLGILDMKVGNHESSSGKTSLSLSMDPRALGCSGPSPHFDRQELHFTYGSTDVYVCLQPDQVAQDQQASANGR